VKPLSPIHNEPMAASRTPAVEWRRNLSGSCPLETNYRTKCLLAVDLCGRGPGLALAPAKRLSKGHPRGVALDRTCSLLAPFAGTAAPRSAWKFHVLGTTTCCDAFPAEMTRLPAPHSTRTHDSRPTNLLQKPSDIYAQNIKPALTNKSPNRFSVIRPPPDAGISNPLAEPQRPK